MRRKVERRVTVSINKEEVLGAAIRMARCPQHCRETAVVEWVNGTVQISWTEDSDTKIDGTPRARMPGRSRTARKDRIDMVGKTYGNWVVLGYAEPHAAPSGVQRSMVLARCGGCNTEKTVSAANLREGATTQCRDCALAEQTVPEAERRCYWCDATGTPDKSPRECEKHARQSWRAGLCPCGEFPFYRVMDCPKCGRKKGTGKPVKRKDVQLKRSGTKQRAASLKAKGRSR